MKLRPYQQSALDALHEYLATKDGNPLIVLPTGTGKSPLQAAFVKEVVQGWANTRVICAVHSRELVAQNYQKLIGMWPDAPAGLHSAGLGRNDMHQAILFASIQSIYKKAFYLPPVDFLIADEADLIPHAGEGQWRRFIADLKTINPQLRIIGLTATPFRGISCTSITDGKGAIFTDVAYKANILDMIAQGYLCEIMPKDTETVLDVKGLQTSGGDFTQGALETRVNIERINRAAVKEIVHYGQDRKSWLIFCSGVDHAHAVAAIFPEHGIECAVVTGDTPTGQRDDILRRLQSGELRAVANNNVLTTGFDAPSIDLIAALRPTKSPRLWVQMLGRGTRPVYAPGADLSTAEGRLGAMAKNCLVLDFARNSERHGPIDEIMPRAKKSSAPGEAPVKQCPECFHINYAAARLCAKCDFAFPEPQPDLDSTASTEALLSSQLKIVQPERLVVHDIKYSRHVREGKTPSMRVDYHCGWNVISEWICFEHTGLPRRKAEAWWSRRLVGVQPKAPATVDEALGSLAQALVPVYISVLKVGKFPEIMGYEF